MRTNWSVAIGLLLAGFVTAGALAVASAADPVPDLGVNASLHGKPVFPAGDWWKKDVSALPVDVASTELIARLGTSTPLHPDFGTSYAGRPVGFEYVVVPGTQPLAPITFAIPGESFPGPYPIPPAVPIEGGVASRGDRHVIVIDRDNWWLYEAANVYPVKRGLRTIGWTAYSGARFSLKHDTERPLCWTSADASGLPIFPGLVRYDEVFEEGAIRHALRFTVAKTRRAFVHPARHFASRSTSPDLPPMGMRMRLKASFDISGFPREAQIILTALKKHGMILADNGGDLYVSGVHDARWNDANLATLGRVRASDFEVVKMGPLVTTCP